MFWDSGSLLLYFFKISYILNRDIGWMIDVKYANLV